MFYNVVNRLFPCYIMSFYDIIICDFYLFCLLEETKHNSVQYHLFSIKSNLNINQALSWLNLTSYKKNLTGLIALFILFPIITFPGNQEIVLIRFRFPGNRVSRD